MNNVLVAQSGGPTPVINSSLAGVVLEALNDKDVDKVYGAYYGIEGVLKENFLCFNDVDLDEVKYLKTTPSSALGSCRYKLPKYEEDKATFEKLFSIFEKLEIKYFFYIGGNDSMDTINRLSIIAKELNSNTICVGIPKTIDNDLNGIDHSPGFGSCSKYINYTIIESLRDSFVYDKKSVTVLEVMGRNAGWIAASTCIAKQYCGAPDLIYLPEVPFSFEKLEKDLNEVFKTKNNVYVVISEGAKFANGKYISEDETVERDTFGHAKLSGACEVIQNYIKNEMGITTKGTKLDILQRSGMHAASLIDVEEAFELGRHGFEYAKEGKNGYMSALVRNSSLPYNISYTCIPISDVANIEKFLPESFLDENKTGITREGFEYFLPLIQGDVRIPKVDGLPRHSTIKPSNV